MPVRRSAVSTIIEDGRPGIVGQYLAKMLGPSLDRQNVQVIAKNFKGEFGLQTIMSVYDTRKEFDIGCT